MAALLVIAFVWAIVVGGAAMKIRTERQESIDGFQRQLRAFAGGLPPLDDAPALDPLSGNARPPVALGTPELLRRILAALLVTVGVSLLYALAMGTRLAWGIHLMMDNCLLAYVALLVHRRDCLAEGVDPFARRARPGPTSAPHRIPAPIT